MFCVRHELHIKIAQNKKSNETKIRVKKRIDKNSQSVLVRRRLCMCGVQIASLRPFTLINNFKNNIGKQEAHRASECNRDGMIIAYARH